MRNTFSFRGTSGDACGVYLENPAPVVHGAERCETVMIPGSAKALHIREGDGAMDPVTVALDCVLRADGSPEAAAAWLRGEGTLILPSDPNHCYKNAWAANALTMDKVIRARKDRRFTVEFECEAWRYRLPEQAAISMSAPGWMDNPGTGPCEPLIAVTGEGSGSLMVGGRTLLIDGLDGTMTLDCEARMAWQNDVIANSLLTRAGDDWPAIPAGGCMVNWSGGISGVVITPRYRDY